MSFLFGWNVPSIKVETRISFSRIALKTISSTGTGVNRKKSIAGGKSPPSEGVTGFLVKYGLDPEAGSDLWITKTTGEKTGVCSLSCYKVASSDRPVCDAKALTVISL